MLDTVVREEGKIEQLITLLYDMHIVLPEIRGENIRAHTSVTVWLCCTYISFDQSLDDWHQ